MTKEELIHILSSLPDNSEVLVDTGEGYKEIRDVGFEYSQRVNERKPYVIIEIYK
jgi:hypothetical protein